MSDPKLRDKIFEDFGNRGGIYKLFLFDGHTIRSVNRALDTDLDGILYIGKANCFTDRVIDLKKSIDPNYCGNHICGRRYKQINMFVKGFPYESMFIKLTVHPEPGKLERQLIDDYVQAFGETPPLNAY